MQRQPTSQRPPPQRQSQSPAPESASNRRMIDEKLSKREYAIIFRGRERISINFVAYKGYYNTEDGRGQKLAETEYRALSDLQGCPNVIQLHSRMRQPSLTWLIMEFCPGTTVGRIIKHDGPIPENLFVPMAVQIATAVFFVHWRKYAHTQVNTNHFIFAADGSIRLIDFSRAILLAPVQGANATSQPLSQAQVQSLIRSDLAAMGGVFLEMLVPEKAALTRNCSPTWADLVGRLMDGQLREWMEIAAHPAWNGALKENLAMTPSPQTPYVLTPGGVPGVQPSSPSDVSQMDISVLASEDKMATVIRESSRYVEQPSTSPAPIRDVHTALFALRKLFERQKTQLPWVQDSPTLSPGPRATTLASGDGGPTVDMLINRLGSGADGPEVLHVLQTLSEAMEKASTRGTLKADELLSTPAFLNRLAPLVKASSEIVYFPIVYRCLYIVLRQLTGPAPEVTLSRLGAEFFSNANFASRPLAASAEALAAAGEYLGLALTQNVKVDMGAYMMRKIREAINVGSAATALTGIRVLGRLISRIHMKLDRLEVLITEGDGIRVLMSEITKGIMRERDKTGLFEMLHHLVLGVKEKAAGIELLLVTAKDCPINLDTLFFLTFSVTKALVAGSTPVGVSQIDCIEKLVNEGAAGNAQAAIIVTELYVRELMLTKRSDRGRLFAVMEVFGSRVERLGKRQVLEGIKEVIVSVGRELLDKREEVLMEIVVSRLLAPAYLNNRLGQVVKILLNSQNNLTTLVNLIQAILSMKEDETESCQDIMTSLFLRSFFLWYDSPTDFVKLELGMPIFNFGTSLKFSPRLCSEVTSKLDMSLFEKHDDCVIGALVSFLAHLVVSDTKPDSWLVRIRGLDKFIYANVSRFPQVLLLLQKLVTHREFALSDNSLIGALTLMIGTHDADTRNATLAAEVIITAASHSNLGLTHHAAGRLFDVLVPAVSHFWGAKCLVFVAQVWSEKPSPSKRSPLISKHHIETIGRAIRSISDWDQFLYLVRAVWLLRHECPGDHNATFFDNVALHCNRPPRPPPAIAASIAEILAAANAQRTRYTLRHHY